MNVLYLLLPIISSCFTATVNKQEGDAAIPRESAKSRVVNAGSKLHSLKYQANICDLSDSLLYNIGQYLINPVRSMGSLNQRFYNTFHGDYSLKFYAMERFNIPEFAIIDKNEKEFNYILALSQHRNDPFFLFGSLIEDIANEKKPYKVLIPPLVLYLERIFKKLSHMQQIDLTLYFLNKFGCSYKNLLIKICESYDFYEPIFKLTKGNSEELTNVFSQIKNREKLMEFFKAHPDLSLDYKNSFVVNGISEIMNPTEIFQHTNLYKWIAECIIYGTPEEFYINFLDTYPYLLKYLDVNYFLFSKIPESEYPRIHAQLQKLLNYYLRPLIDNSNGISRDYFDFYNLFNDIRFGSLTVKNLNISSNRLIIITKAALLGNKKDLFFEIYNSPEGKKYNVFDEIIKMGKDGDFYMYLNSFKIVFELMANSPEEFIFDRTYLMFLKKFYAINHMKVNQNRVLFEFVALENLLILEFPPIISVDADLGNFSVFDFVINVFSLMEVFNEYTIASVFSDFYRENSVVSLELMKFILGSPNLIKKFAREDMKFSLEFESINIPKLFRLPIPKKAVRIIKRLKNLRSYELIELKTEAQIKVFEKIGRKSVAHYYFDWEHEHEHSGTSDGYRIKQCDYFQWRLVFSYWIKGDQKDRIKQIKSAAIIKMLRLEFPREMDKLLGPESA